jgi:hypothetical protein
MNVFKEFIRTIKGVRGDSSKIYNKKQRTNPPK